MIAALVLLIGTYPSVPTLFMLLPSPHKVSFVALAGMLILACAPFWRRVEYPKPFVWLMAATAAFLAFKYYRHGTPTAARELIVLACAIALAKLDLEVLRRVIDRASLFLAVLLAVSFVVVVWYWLGMNIHDWRVEWMPEIGTDNPLFVRNADDRDFYFPLYLAVLPLYSAGMEVAFGLEFVRQPLIFTEWSYSWYFLVPLLFITRSRLCKAMFAVALAISFSVWGLLMLPAVLLLMRFARIFRRPWVLIACACLALWLIAASLAVEDALEMLGGNKLQQFQFFTTFDPSATITTWGDPSYEGEWGIYGVMHLLYLYGTAGFGIFLLTCAYAVWSALRVMTRARFHSRDALMFAGAVTFIVLADLKLSYFVSLYQLVLMAYLVRLLVAEAPVTVRRSISSLVFGVR